LEKRRASIYMGVRRATGGGRRNLGRRIHRGGARLLLGKALEHADEVGGAAAGVVQGRILRGGGGLGRVAGVLGTIKGPTGRFGQRAQRRGLGRGQADRHGIGGPCQIVLWVVGLIELQLFDLFVRDHAHGQSSYLHINIC